MNEKDRNIGKVMTLREIEETHPNCVVGISEYNQEHKPIIVRLICVCHNDEEEAEYIKKFEDKEITLSWMETYKL